MLRQNGLKRDLRFRRGDLRSPPIFVTKNLIIFVLLEVWLPNCFGNTLGVWSFFWYPTTGNFYLISENFFKKNWAPSTKNAVHIRIFLKQSQIWVCKCIGSYKIMLFLSIFDFFVQEWNSQFWSDLHKNFFWHYTTIY